MSRYLQLQKLTTDLTSSSTIIIKQDDILQVSETVAQNRNTQQQENVRQVILIGYPEYSFITRVSLATFESSLKIVDITGGIGVGSSCSVPGVLDTVSIDTIYPMVKLWKIKNTIKTLTEYYLANLNYLYIAEEVPFTDEELNTQVTAMMISFKGNPIRKTLTNVSLSDLASILEPTILV